MAKWGTETPCGCAGDLWMLTSSHHVLMASIVGLAGALYLLVAPGWIGRPMRSDGTAEDGRLDHLR